MITVVQKLVRDQPLRLTKHLLIPAIHSKSHRNRAAPIKDKPVLAVPLVMGTALIPSLPPLHIQVSQLAHLDSAPGLIIILVNLAIEAEVAPSFELSEKDKQRLLQLAASKDTTGARSLIPDADSILVIKASEGEDDGAEKVQGFLRQHPYKIQNAEARTELHVCRMRVWIEGGRVEQDELPCYLSNRVPRSVFTTHDNVVRHHKTVHFKIPRAEQVSGISIRYSSS